MTTRLSRLATFTLLAAWLCADPAVAQTQPEVIGEGVISTDQIEYGPTFTPSGDTLYFTRRASFREAPQIYWAARMVDGWTSPEPVSFSSEAGDEHPSLSPDGQRLYFSSTRPVDGVEQQRNDLWMVTKTPDGWSTPEHLGGSLSTPDIDSHPVETDAGLLFHSRRPGSESVDAYLAPGRPGAWGEPVLLPFNSSAIDGEAAPHPSGRALVFYSERDGGHGRGDLYIVHRNGEAWGVPQNLGPAINTDAWEWTPTFTPDGSRLAFSRLTPDGTDADLYLVDPALAQD